MQISEFLVKNEIFKFLFNEKSVAAYSLENNV